MKTYIFFLLGAISLTANPFNEFQQDQKIAIQNSILAKVNGRTISMIDVKKKMDMMFHQYYPQLIDSTQARYQFYEASWERVLRDMIDQELIISDALDKEIKITDGEIREEIEMRFGPKVTQTLDQIGLTHKEAREMVKNEMIVQRMTGWFVHQKAFSGVTPQDIRQAYRLYLKENPPYSEWTYKIISIRAKDQQEQLAKKVYESLKNTKTPPTKEALEEFKTDGVSLTISNEYSAKSTDLSEAHKTAIASLEEGEYSLPSYQFSRRDNKSVYRIFYLSQKKDFPAPTFEVMANRLRDELVQKAAMEESDEYISKLRKHYGYEENQMISEELTPFSLQ